MWFGYILRLLGWKTWDSVLTGGAVIEAVIGLLVFFAFYRPSKIPIRQPRGISAREIIIWKFRTAEEWRGIIIFLLMSCFYVGFLGPFHLYIEDQKSIKLLQQQIRENEGKDGYDKSKYNAAIDRNFHWENGKGPNVIIDALDNVGRQEYGNDKYEEAALSFNECYDLQASPGYQGGSGYPDEREAQEWPVLALCILKGDKVESKAEANNHFRAFLSEQTQKIHQAVSNRTKGSYYSSASRLKDCVRNLEQIKDVAPPEVLPDIDAAIKTIAGEQTNFP